MQQPILVIMAAGMGSRFGGLKQITPVDDQGHFLIDYSLYDAWRAGFRKAVFIIKNEMEDYFKATIGKNVGNRMKISYVYQKLSNIPDGFSVPDGREKPWGTAHAIMCAEEAIDGPFAVINADDFYGAEAFKAIFAFLQEEKTNIQHAMVGYCLKNTLTEHGGVSRGICRINNGMLTGVSELKGIEKRGDDGVVRSENGVYIIPGDTVVSMNLWGFNREMLYYLKKGFPRFLRNSLCINPLKCEYLLPDVVNEAIGLQKADVRVLTTHEQWHGITYRDDLSSLCDALEMKNKAGLYPEKLWG